MEYHFLPHRTLFLPDAPIVLCQSTLERLALQLHLKSEMPPEIKLLKKMGDTRVYHFGRYLLQILPFAMVLEISWPFLVP